MLAFPPVLNMTPGEGCALSPRQNVALSFYTCAISFAVRSCLRLVTHILFCRGMEIFGNCGISCSNASAWALVRAFFDCAFPPGMMVM